MSKVLVLMACLDADINEQIKKSRISSDTVIVNQCSRDNEYVVEKNGFKIYVLESREKGLSKSRNLALKKASQLEHDIVLFTDDDVVFLEGYEKEILDKYSAYPDADLIAFDYYRISDTAQSLDIYNLTSAKSAKKVLRTHKYFSSVRISVKKEFIIRNLINFNPIFGAGSGIYSHGEDSIFVKDVRNNGGIIYQVNSKIVKVEFFESTWRSISNEVLFNDKGALIKELSPKFYWFFGLPLILKMSHEMRVNFFTSYRQFLVGASLYQKEV